MAPASSTIALGTATDQLVGDRPAGHTSGRSIFPSIMQAARGWWMNKAAAELATIIGCEVRSAERYLAGDRTPDAEAVLAILRSEHGAKLVEAAVADLPADRQRAFWNEMAMAVVRATAATERNALRG